jgi:hypothetical protein
VRAFLDRYATREVRLRTNEWGERWTLPALDAPGIVLVAGDSVAHGSLVEDAETLASRLQARDPSRRYVNLGVGGADGPDIACGLERAAARYRGRVRELVYVYCENDFEPGEPLGEPEEVMDRLEALVAREGISRVSVVLAPYFYNVVPHLTRFRGYRGWNYPANASQRERLEARVRAAGFRWIDPSELALEAAVREGSELAALGFFADHVHWSPAGTARVAEALLRPGAQ